MPEKDLPSREKEMPIKEGMSSTAADNMIVSLPPPPRPPSSGTASRPPSYQKIERENNEDNVEMISCRICLECDHPEDMIAPCKCKGGSKWVHRQCLNQWRIHETNRAFSKCTECLFEYHLQPTTSTNHRQRMSPQARRRVKYCFLVSRDLCLATVTLQIIIAILGWIISLTDPDQKLPVYINAEYPVAVYYSFGFLALLVLLGIVGCTMLCSNGCSVRQSLEPFPEVRLAPITTTDFRNDDQQYQPTYAERRAYYQTQRQRSQSRRQRCDGCCTHCCLDCYYNPSPYYYGDNGACFYCCSCCDEELGGATAGRNISSSGAGSHDCDCCNCCPDGGNRDCGECILVLLVFLAVIMAIVGFLVGIIMLVIIFQRTVQRHIYIMHKRQLATEFQVMDLSEYDLEKPIPSSPEEESSKEGPAIPVENPVLSAPPLTDNDSAYLKNLRLKE